jgi:hypothetical protein
MKLQVNNIGKILNNGISFNWIKVAPLPDRYTFHIQSNDTQNIYYLDLHRFSEHENGTYRLMLTNSKYRNENNKKWLTLNDIKSIDGFKGICVDLIRSISIEETPF